MNRCFKKYVEVGLLLLCSVSARAQSNTPAPSVGLKDIKGHRFSLNEYKGKIVLVNFWATWCPPCRKEIPDLIRMQRDYRTKGLRIIGITYPPQTVAEVRRFAKRVRMNYPVVLGTKAIKSIFTSSETLPITVIIDREGAVRGVVEGIMYPDEFDQTVKPLLSAVPSRQKSEDTTQRSRAQRAFINVTTRGYEPSGLTLYAGRRAELTFIRKVENTCGTRIVIPAYDINRELPLNGPVTVSFTPNRSGRFKFTCGMNMFRGSIVVR